MSHYRVRFLLPSNHEAEVTLEAKNYADAVALFPTWVEVVKVHRN